MDGKGGCMDNIFVEHRWRSPKYEGCTSTPMRPLPRPRLVLAPGSASTTTSASIRALVTARRGKSMRKAYGYVDDRLHRPAPLPQLPEQARKAGKCSPSPTSPQAPPPTKELMSMIRRIVPSCQPAR